MKQVSICTILLLSLFFTACVNSQEADKNTISLAGEWHFNLDSTHSGVKEKWYEKIQLDTITLPTTTDVAQKGKLNTRTEYGRFTRLYPYGGSAWYQKEIEIPEKWTGKDVFFFMELTKASSVWVDDNFLGKQISLTAPHIYNLTQYLTPGKHLLSVMIDNNDNPPVGWPHQISDQTQTNWNGILGRIELQVKDPIHMDDMQVYSDIHKKEATVKIKFNKKCSGTLTLSAKAWNTDVKHSVKTQKINVETNDDGDFIAVLPMGEKVQLWDEFNPALYKLQIKFNGEFDGRKVADYKEINFGMREFKTNGSQFKVNGKNIFLRGKHESHVFPITGHVPMDVDEWVRIFKIAKSYGMNHYRYHTCVPCEAAFTAADMVGIYLEPQLPRWGQVGDSNFSLEDVEIKKDNSSAAELVKYMMFEGHKILNKFGNHASFCMFSLGNELHGDRALMSQMVVKFRASDNRHLYASGSNNFLWDPALSESDDYWTTTFTGGHYTAGNYYPDTKGLDTRSSYPVHTVGQINNVYPNTTYTYASAIKGVPVPVISHENGQFQVYPDFNEIKKFTGVVRAKNYEIYRERLKKAGMLDQANNFFRASGALAAICYRADLETAIRTKGFGGFQMLDLQDFPGQGTALVGMLDVFMDSKGIIKPEKWSEFSSPVVPQLQMAKYTWTNNEKFSGLVSIANYGADDINSTLNWKIVDKDENILQEGEMPIQSKQGSNADFEIIKMDLSNIATAQKLMVCLLLNGTDAKNSYPVWIYPASTNPETDNGKVTIATKLDKATKDKLENGETVLLLPDSTLLTNAVDGAFQTDFWCYPMFKKYSPPGTLGILCNPEHPIFNEFPTEYHSNWQWWPMLKYGKAMILDSTPTDFRPTVQVIDNFERNHKLGVIFECKVGNGKLLVCCCDFTKKDKYPEERQLLHSILKYMNSNDFNPESSLTVNDLMKIFNEK